jgi:hypothetical protein
MSSEEGDQEEFQEWIEGELQFWEYYSEHREQAIEEFELECLQSFYKENPYIAGDALSFLAAARRFLAKPTPPTNVIAAHLFASIAVEVGLKIVLIKPIVYGLISSEPVANLIADLALRNRLGGFRDLLYQILSQYGGVDFRKHQRAGSKKSLWKEIIEVQERRDKIVHRAEEVSFEQAEQTIAVASTILEDVFPHVINSLGLHSHDNGHTICDGWCTGPDGEPFGDVDESAFGSNGMPF